MLTQKGRQYGITLIEVILTLTVAGAILLMGIRQYQLLQRENYIQQINYNVDSLFQAAAYYYYANCKGGTLDFSINPQLPPPASPLAPNSHLLNIKNDLITPGFLRVTIPSNPLISGIGTAGYLVQLNVYTAARNACTSANCATSTQIGTNVMWTIQVSALLANPGNATTFQNLTRADCVTSISGYGTASPCSMAATYASNCQTFLTPTGNWIVDFINDILAGLFGCNNNISNYNNYLSWERAPSMVIPSAKPALWQTMPTVKQFKQMYETLPMSVLTTTSHSPEFQYFQCGS